MKLSKLYSRNLVFAYWEFQISTSMRSVLAIKTKRKQFSIDLTNYNGKIVVTHLNGESDSNAIHLLNGKIKVSPWMLFVKLKSLIISISSNIL